MEQEEVVISTQHLIADLAVVVGFALASLPTSFNKDFSLDTFAAVTDRDGKVFEAFAIRLSIRKGSKMKDESDMASRTVLLPFKKLDEMPTNATVIFSNSYKKVDMPHSVESYVPLWIDDKVNTLQRISTEILNFLRFGIIPRSAIITKINTNN